MGPPACHSRASQSRWGYSSNCIGLKIVACSRQALAGMQVGSRPVHLSPFVQCCHWQQIHWQRSNLAAASSACSGAVQAFFAALPVNCTLYPSNGKPAYVFRWYSGAAPAGAKLVIQSCGTVVGSMVPLVSVRSSSYANIGPFTCLG